MKIELYHTTSELKALFRKEKDPRLAARIRAVYLGLPGKNAPQIAILPGYSRRTVQNWNLCVQSRGSGLRHLREAATQAWHKVCLDPEKIKSICRAVYVERAFI